MPMSEFSWEEKSRDLDALLRGYRDGCRGLRTTVRAIRDLHRWVRDLHRRVSKLENQEDDPFVEAQYRGQKKLAEEEEKP